MVCVTALPCKISITTFAIRLYMFITINNNKYKKNVYFTYMIHVKNQRKKNYGTLLKCCAWS